MHIKLICTDIDGTLLNAARWLSEATVAAFAKAELPTILASSRMPSAMHYIQESLGIAGSALIAYNGGLIIGRNNTILKSTTFNLSILEAVIEHQKTCSYNISIYSNDDWYTASKDQWTLREINNTRVQPILEESIKILARLDSKQRGIHKIMIMGNPSELDSVIEAHVSYKDEVHFYRSKDTYIEITPKNIDKAKALKLLLEKEFDFEMDAVMSFGDNHNDNELTKKAGFGVAVGNATDQLKVIADYVSPFTNKEDAVARAINKFLIAN